MDNHTLLQVIFVLDCGHSTTIWSMTEHEAVDRIGKLRHCPTCHEAKEVTGFKAR